MLTFPASGRSWMIMTANAFPRSLPSAAMPNPIVSHTPQPTCSFGSGVLSPGNSQSICHAVMDAFPLSRARMDWLATVGNSESLRTQTFVMRSWGINRADRGSLLHLELKAALGITMLSAWTSHRPEGKEEQVSI